MIQLGGRGLV